MGPCQHAAFEVTLAHDLKLPQNAPKMALQHFVVWRNQQLGKKHLRITTPKTPNITTPAKQQAPTTLPNLAAPQSQHAPSSTNMSVGSGKLGMTNVEKSND